MIKNQGLLKAAYEDQLRLQRLTVSQFGMDASGKPVATFTIPKEVPQELNTVRNQMGWIRNITLSAANQMINWGKNVQWAGRQLTVGLSVPLAAFGAAAGIMAFKANQGITNIQKVYNTTATTMEGRAKELAAVSTGAMNEASAAAEKYGSSLQDTLAVEAQLAAVGKQGNELIQSTDQVLRLATLGQMDYNTSLQAAISLQSVFKMNSEELTKTIDYMNAVENQTSLTMQDFATAIPIAAGPIKALGGNIKELGTLLVAMKQNGIPATQGANAIKASLQRILNPSQAVIDLFDQMTHKSLPDLVKKTQGDVIPTFEALYEAVKPLDQLSREQLLAKLFGTYQSTRLSAILNSIGDLKQGIGQVSQAAKIAGESQTQLAQIAATELHRQMSSISGQFKKTISELQIQLARMGTPFLEWATLALKGIVRVINAFNNLPGAVKKVASLVAIFAALVGPTVMLVGLFANFWGNLVKFSGVLAGLLGKMPIINKQQKLGAVMAEAAAKQYSQETIALKGLTEQVELLNQAFTEQAALARRQVSASAPLSTLWMGTQGKANLSNAGVPVMFTAAEQTQITAQKEAQAKAQAEEAASAQKAQKFMGGAALAGGAFSGAMAASMISSNKMVDSVAKWTMIISLGLPAILAMKSAVAFMASAPLKDLFKIQALTGYTTGIKTAAAAEGSLWTKTKGVANAATMGNASMLAWGAALVAAGVAANYLYNKMKSASAATKATYDDATGLAAMFNFTVSDKPMTTIGTKQVVNSLSQQVKLVEEFRSKYADAVVQIRNANTDQEKYNQALIQGVKVIESGGTAAEAKQAVLVALTAAQGIANAHHIIMKFGADFTSERAVVDKMLMVARTEFQNSQKKNPWWQGMFGGLPGVGNNANTAAEAAGKQWAEAFSTGVQSGNVQETTSALAQALAAVASASKNELPGGQSQGYLAFTQFAHSLGMSDQAAQALFNDLKNGALSTYQVMLKLNPEMTRLQKIAFLIAQQRKGLLGFADSTTLLGLQVINAAANVQSAINQKILQQNKDINNEHYMRVREMEYEKANLSQQNALYADQLKIIQQFNFQQAVQGAYQQAQTDIGTAIGNAFQQKMDAALNALQQDGQARLDAFDKMVQARDAKFTQQEAALQKQDQRQTDQFNAEWTKRVDMVKAEYQKRIDAIQGEIDAEQKANQIRQNIYNDEIQRIQNLADLASKNIDLNIAIGSGNMDEAARVAGDIQSTQQQNALQKAETQAERASQNRIDNLNKELTAEQDAEQKRLDMLQKLEDAQKKAMDRQQQRREQDLKDEQTHYDKVMALRRDQLNKSIQMAEQEAQARWTARQTELNREIQLFESYVPTSLQDEQRWIDQMGQKYDEFGGVLKQHGIHWSKIIGDALSNQVQIAMGQLKTDVAWAAIGRSSAIAMVKGAFGMTLPQFERWAGLKDQQGHFQPPGHIQPPGGTPQYHEGGPVAGRFGGPGLRHDEQIAKLKKPEFVLNEIGRRTLGDDILHAANQGALHNGKATDTYHKPIGGAGLGLTGWLGAALVSGFKSILSRGLSQYQMAGSQYAAGKAGDYAGYHFDLAQLKNAATIASVGSSVGATRRDIIVALMTAMQESTLRNLNYGTGTSVGLFQQIPDWGTYAQRMNPAESARMFFEGGHAGEAGLLDIFNRNEMSYAEEAQAVQHSAYPGRYAQWLSAAVAVLNGLRATPGGGPVGTGIFKPVSGGYISQGLHDQDTGYPAIDIGVPIGTPVYAAAGGRVTVSKDLRGYESRIGHQNGYYSYGRYMQVAGTHGEQLYAHLSQRLYPEGATVQPGQRIGLSGLTGHTYGPHVHFGSHGPSPYMFWNQGQMPQARKGAEMLWDGPVLAHKKELILTAELSQKLKDGINNMSRSTNAEIHHHAWNLEIHPSEGMDERKFANYVIAEIDKRKGNVGRTHIVGK